MKCFYHIDNDGKCAAAIVARANPKEVEFVPTNYNIPFPLETIKENEPVIIVDFSLTPDMMHKLLDVTPNVIWIDHHKTAIEKFKGDMRVNDLTGIRDVGKAGCELTWAFLFPGLPVPKGVQYIGDYDTWTFKYGDLSRQFYYGLMCVDTNPTSSFWQQLFSGYMINLVLEKGRTVMEYREVWSRDYLNVWAFEAEFLGHHCLLCNIAQAGSPFFGAAFDEYDIVMPFVLDKKGIVTVSLYSKSVDVGELAKGMGGGGHTGAAGFQVPVAKFVELFIR